jgi:hypothetical protein
LNYLNLKQLINNINQRHIHDTGILLLYINENFIYGVVEMIIHEHVIVCFVLILVNISLKYFIENSSIDLATRQWSLVPILGSLVPSARDGHSACIIHNRMYIFGGFEDIVNTI